MKVYQGTVLKGTATTNTSGSYSIGVLNTGTYSVEASAAGYETNTQSNISVTNGSTTTFNITLAVAINYVYDELGRLVSVIDKDGNAATYSYDAVGNLLSISRQVPTVVAIIRFSPTSGAVGSTVTIYGSGFSATASQNSVTFNGNAATVSASSTNLIVVTVPAGATTGSIGVTSPTGSVTSASSFTVGSSSLGTPTITSFTPTVGTAGTSVSISGTNFDTTVSNDKASFNVSYALIGTVTSTSISTTLPTRTGSGRVSVTTPFGKAVSTADFIVPPSPYGASDLAYTDRISIGGAKTITINTANKIGLLLFDGIANQRVSLGYANNTIAFGALKIINPDGTNLFSFGSGLFQSTGFFDPVRLPLTGTYTIFVDPENTNTGGMPITLYDVPVDVTGSITIGGAAVSVSMTTPGQNAVLGFSANAGQKVSLNLTNVTVSLADVYILDQWGASLGTVLAGTGGGFLNTITLPSTSSYKIFVSPRLANTGSATLTLYNTNDLTETITPGGSAVSVSLSTLGQNARLTFNGTSGQRVSLKGTSNTIPLGTIAIRNPDNSVLTSLVGSLGSSPFLDVKTLATTGTYSVLVDPENMQLGAVTLTLYDVPADGTGSINIGGSSVGVSVTTPGQNASLSFSGTAGQKISLSTSNWTISQCTTSIKKPDGTTLTSTTGSFIDRQALPTTGTYSVSIDPTGTSTGGVTLTLNDCADFTGSVTVGGSAVAVNLTVPGQLGVLTFSGTSGQQVTVHITGNTLGDTTVKLLKPDGTILTSATSSNASFNLSTQTLPTTGTYSIVVDPNSANTGSLNVSVTSP